MSEEKKVDEKKLPEKQDEKQSIAEIVAAAVRATMESVIPASLAAAARVQIEQAALGRLAQDNARALSQERCGTCKQLKRGCENDHDLIVVFPVGQFLPHEAVKSFPGITVNGVTYKSRNSRHRVFVPKKNDIATAVNDWVRSESELRFGRAKAHGLDDGNPVNVNQAI